MNPLDAAVIREGRPADHNLVRSEWLRCYARSAFARAMTAPELWHVGKASPEYWTGHHEVITRLLAKSELLVLTWPEDDWTCIGWVVFERPSTLHWVQVLADYRRNGVARRLFEAAGLATAPAVTYTHRSRGCDRLPIPAQWRLDVYGAFL